MLYSSLSLNSSFLSEQDLIRFKRGACLFCNKTLDTQLVKERHEVERMGSHYDAHYAYRLHEQFLISDLDIYVFNLSVDEWSKNELKLREEKLLKELEENKKLEIEASSKNLTNKFFNLGLSEKQIGLAVGAITKDALYDTSLKEDVERLFMNLRLNDLELIPRRYVPFDYYDDSKDPRYHAKLFFDPSGLKTHKKCWPFAPFEGTSNFPMQLGDFFNNLKKNPTFDNYTARFENFPELWDYALGLNVRLEAKNYNPLDYIRKIN